MALNITKTLFSGSTVTAHVNNSGSAAANATVYVTVHIAGIDHNLVSSSTSVPANSTLPIQLQAPGPVEYIVDSPEPTVLNE